MEVTDDQEGDNPDECAPQGEPEAEPSEAGSMDQVEENPHGVSETTPQAEASLVPSILTFTSIGQKLYQIKHIKLNILPILPISIFFTMKEIIFMITFFITKS